MGNGQLASLVLRVLPIAYRQLLIANYPVPISPSGFLI
jgi:hypothetical protein